MPLTIQCTCGKPLLAKDEFAGKRVKCPVCGAVLSVPAAEAPVVVEKAISGEAPAAPAHTPRRPTGDRPHREEENPGAHRLSRFGVLWVILLNAVTVGLFASIWFNLMHGRMPKLRSDDPSAAKGFWFLLIPFFNLYWLFFTFLRLITRINEQRAFRGLPPSRLRGLVISFCIIHLVSSVILMFVFPPGIWINPISLVLGCIVFSVIQGRVNELVDASAFAPALGEGKTCPRCAERVKAAATACRFCGHEFVESAADTALRQEDDAALAVKLRQVVCRNRRGLCLTWGWLLNAVGLAFLGILIPYVLGFKVPPPPDGPDLITRIIGVVFFTVPFLVPGFICLFRAHRYRRELVRIEDLVQYNGSENRFR